MLIQLLLPPPGSQKEFDIWTMELAQAMFFPCYFVFTSLQLHIVVSFHIIHSMQKPIPLRHLPYTHIYSVFLSPHLLGCFHFILSFVSSFLLPSWLIQIRKKRYISVPFSCSDLKCLILVCFLWFPARGPLNTFNGTERWLRKVNLLQIGFYVMILGRWLC